MAGERITCDLPLSPSLNEMIQLAKRRTRRSRTGGFMRRTLPVVYDQHLEAYEDEAVVMLRQQGVRPPAAPWERWALTRVAFRLRNLRDWTEVLASLKWPIDVLVRQGFVADDSPREMAPPPCPEQTIDRRRPGITLTIERLG